MKRFLLRCAAACTAAALVAGCSHHVSKSMTFALVEPAPGDGFGLFAREAESGLRSCSRETGARVRLVPSKNEPDVERELLLMATEAPTAVVAIGPLAAEPLARIARRFEGQRFVLIDGLLDAPNIEALTFDMHAGSYAAGALAALLSRTHHVAFIGGEPGTIVQPYAAGFAAGARAIDPATRVSIDYAGSFSDSQAGTQTAQRALTSGADVLYVAAGRAGSGAIAAAAAHHIPSIAADTDQNATPGVAASVVKDIAAAAKFGCEEVVSRKPRSGPLALGLNDGVKLRLTAATQARLGPAGRRRLQAALATLH